MTTENNSSVKDIPQNEDFGPMERKKKKPVLRIVVSLIVVVLIAVLALQVKLVIDSTKPVQSEKEVVTFTVESGESLKSVSDRLEEEGIIHDSQIAYYFAKYKHLTNLVAGNFSLDKSWNLQEIYTYLNDPLGAKQDMGRVTIVEGDWAKDIAIKISEATSVSYDDLISLWNNKEWIQSKQAEYPFLTEEMFQDGVRIYLEGYLAPETYQFNKETTAEEVTCIILDQTLAVYNQYRDQIEASPLTTHQIYTLASIVQYEGGGDEEVLKNISSVFYNRLNIGMKLQSSVTVCYAIDFDKQEDTWQACEVNSDFESPYNTYMYEGLPPGAIENAGVKAFDAVLNPNDTDYLYFMADVNGDGTVYFSQTLEEHEALVQQYLN